MPDQISYRHKERPSYHSLPRFENDMMGISFNCDEIDTLYINSFIYLGKVIKQHLQTS